MQEKEIGYIECEFVCFCQLVVSRVFVDSLSNFSLTFVPLF